MFLASDFLSLDPLPSATAQLGVNAMESLSLVLQKALIEDTSGIIIIVIIIIFIIILIIIIMMS